MAVASVLFSVESLIPSPFPWIRLGLANAVTLLALKWWGLREAFVISILRVMLGSLLVGRFLQPVFVLSLSGGLAAVLGMRIAMRYEDRAFSLIGISTIGALSKNTVQLFVAYSVYIRHGNLLGLVPLFVFSSLVTGIVVGFLAHLVDGRMRSLLWL